MVPPAEVLFEERKVGFHYFETKKIKNWTDWNAIPPREGGQAAEECKWIKMGCGKWKEHTCFSYQRAFKGNHTIIQYFKWTKEVFPKWHYETATKVSNGDVQTPEQALAVVAVWKRRQTLRLSTRQTRSKSDWKTKVFLAWFHDVICAAGSQLGCQESFWLARKIMQVTQAFSSVSFMLKSFSRSN